MLWEERCHRHRLPRKPFQTPNIGSPCSQNSPAFSLALRTDDALMELCQLSLITPPMPLVRVRVHQPDCTGQDIEKQDGTH